MIFKRKELKVARIVNYILDFGMTIERMAKDSGIDEKTLCELSAGKACDRKTVKKLLSFVDRVHIELPSKTLVVNTQRSEHESSMRDRPLS